MELAAILILIGVILYQGWVNFDQRRYFEKKEQNLLDRIMANHYPTYIQGEVAKEQVKQPLTPEQIYEMQQERGIPV
jgi:hypothetical protein